MTQWSISIVYVGIYHVSLKIRLSSTIYDYMASMPLSKIEMYHLMGFGLFSYDYIPLEVYESGKIYLSMIINKYYRPHNHG